jgi:hypothetical protein
MKIKHNKCLAVVVLYLISTIAYTKKEYTEPKLWLVKSIITFKNIANVVLSHSFFTINNPPRTSHTTKDLQAAMLTTTTIN